MRLGIIEYIDSAHFIPGHETCGETHGHTYKIEVIIEGEKDEKGMVIDFLVLKKTLRKVLSEYDHRLLNDKIQNPTCENLIDNIHYKLSDLLKFPFTIKIWEGKNMWVER